MKETVAQIILESIEPAKKMVNSVAAPTTIANVGDADRSCHRSRRINRKIVVLGSNPKLFRVKSLSSAAGGKRRVLALCQTGIRCDRHNAPSLRCYLIFLLIADRQFPIANLG